MSNTHYEWNPAQCMQFWNMADDLLDLPIDDFTACRTIEFYDAQRRDAHIDPEVVLNRFYIKLKKLEQRANNRATAQGETSDHQPQGISTQQA